MSGEDAGTEIILAAMDDAGLRESPESDPEPAAAASTQAESSDERPAPAAAADPTPAEDDEKEIAALEAEIRKDKKIKGRIEVARHQAVLTRARKQYEAQIAERDAKLKDYAKYDEKDYQAKLAALDLADNPEVFLAYLKSQDPRYKALLDRETAAPAPAKVVPAAPASDDDLGPEPKPDRLNEVTGEAEYSTAQTAKFVRWHIEQNKRELAKQHAEKIASLEKEYAPIKERYQAETVRQTHAEKAAAEVKRARENWKGYTDHEADIQAYYLANENATLFDAYREVVIKKLADREKTMETEVRAKIVKEMNSRPSAPQRPAPGERAEATISTDNSPEAADARAEAIIRAKYRELASQERA